MVDVVGTASSRHYSVTARPNCSLSPGEILCVYSCLALFTLLFAVAFAWIGAWPVLPFAGAELVGITLCLQHVWRHAGDFERLTMHDGKVVLETHEPGLDRRVELNCYWAQLVLDCMADGYCRRLALRSHGREIEFGRHLSSEERLDVARQLKPRLSGFLA